MSNKLFGLYLLERGILTRETLLKAMDIQKEITQPVAVLAVESHWLSPEKMAVLDVLYQDTVGQSHVELATMLGYITEEQIAELQQKSVLNWMLLAEALLHMNCMSLTQIAYLVQEYLGTQEPDESLRVFSNGGRTANPGADTRTRFLEASIELFLHYTKQFVDLRSVHLSESNACENSYCFSQKLAGDLNTTYVQSVPADLICQTAQWMMGQEVDDVDEVSIDAVTEFVNIIVGNACIKCSIDVFDSMPQPPAFLEDHKLKRSLCSDLRSLSLETEEKELLCHFVCDG